MGLFNIRTTKTFSSSFRTRGEATATERPGHNQAGGKTTHESLYKKGKGIWKNLTKRNRGESLIARPDEHRSTQTSPEQLANLMDGVRKTFDQMAREYQTAQQSHIAQQSTTQITNLLKNLYGGNATQDQSQETLKPLRTLASGISGIKRLKAQVQGQHLEIRYPEWATVFNEVETLGTPVATVQSDSAGRPVEFGLLSTTGDEFTHLLRQLNQDQFNMLLDRWNKIPEFANKVVKAHKDWRPYAPENFYSTDEGLAEYRKIVPDPHVE
ncbi:MAG: hypothetical protein V7642_5799 [Burkholderiales bacterium]|jgi:hypothetical protein